MCSSENKNGDKNRKVIDHLRNTIMKKFRIIRLRGKLKGFFFLSKLHYIVNPFANLLHLLVYISRISKWISEHKNVEYNDFYTFKFNYSNRINLYQFVYDKENLNEFDYLEFGVATGNSMKWWINKNKNPNTRFYGFDTFTGLPESWGSYKKGDISTNNNLPNIFDNRCKFIKGLFQETLHIFIKNHTFNKRKVIHLDADLFSSTIFVLTSLAPYLEKGDILFFDEFNVPLHEFRAFIEFVKSYYINYEVLGAVNNFYQTAIKIT